MNHAERVRGEYAKLAADYDQRWSRYTDATLSETLASLELEGTERILDVPIGTGPLAKRLLAKWPDLNIAGVDVSLEMLEQAAQKPELSSVQMKEACASELPFEDDAFDCVFCVNSFHFFAAPEASLREMRRVLRDGGRLVLVDWCDDYLICKLCSLWLRMVDPAFHRTYTLEHCQRMLRECGFETVTARRFRVNWLWGMMRIEAG